MGVFSQVSSGLRNQDEAPLDQFQHELQDTRSRAGLTDHQAELRHQEDVFSKAVGALNAGLSGLRADLQPLAISNMVGTMKTMGIGDN